MIFSSLVSMWFALALPLIVLMYLLKRKYEDTVVPSHLLWNRVLKQLEANQLWQRLDVRLLLILQLLAALFLVLAIAQPMVAMSGKSYAHAVLVLDRSASMQALVNQEDSGLAIAKRQAIEYVEADRADVYSVVVTGNEAELIATNSADQGAIIAAIEDVDIDFGETDLWQVLSVAESLAVDEEDGIVFFTDGLWPDQIPFNRPITFVSPYTTEAESKQELFNNAYISQFGVKHTELGEVAGSGVIGNVGGVERDVLLSLYVDDELASVKQLTIAPDSQETVFFGSLPFGEVYKLELDAEADSIVSDNQYYAFLASSETKTALLVGGEGRLFLQRSLELAGLNVVHSQLDDAGQYVFPDSAVDLLVLSSVEQGQLDQAVWESKLNQLPVWSIGSLMEGRTASLTNDESVVLEPHPVTQHIQLADTYVAQVTESDRYKWPALSPIVEKDGVPLMLAGDHDGYRKLLFTFELADSDLPLKMDFPILVHNAVTWLVGEVHDPLGTATAGSMLGIPLHVDTAQTTWEAVDVDASSMEVEIEQVSAVEGPYFQLPKTPGLYRLVERTSAGELIRTRYLHVRSDPQETQYSYLPIWERDLTDQTDVTSPMESNDRESPLHLSRYYVSLSALFAAFVLLIVLLEWGVYQRARSV